MAQLTTDKITEIYCIADDFCKEFSKEIKNRQILPDDGKRHGNRSFAMSDAGIITIKFKLNIKYDLLSLRQFS